MVQSKLSLFLFWVSIAPKCTFDSADSATERATLGSPWGDQTGPRPLIQFFKVPYLSQPFHARRGGAFSFTEFYLSHNASTRGGSCRASHERVVSIATSNLRTKAAHQFPFAVPDDKIDFL